MTPGLRTGVNSRAPDSSACAAACPSACGRVRRGCESQVKPASWTFDWYELRLWQDVETISGTQRVGVPFPEPRLAGSWSVIYGIDDLVTRAWKNGGEPRASGRRVRDAMEIETALNESHRRGNVRVDLPLPDRSHGLEYDAFR